MTLRVGACGVLTPSLCFPAAACVRRRACDLTGGGCPSGAADGSSNNSGGLSEAVLPAKRRWLAELSDDDAAWLAALPYTLRLEPHRALIVHAGLVRARARLRAHSLACSARH